MKRIKRLFCNAMVWVGFAFLQAHGQVPSKVPSASESPAMLDAEQTAQLLGLPPLTQRLSILRGARQCGTAATPEELTLRQQVEEVIQAAALDVDSVVAEISNEEGELSNLRTTLQASRDKTVAKYNTAALIAGSGAGAAVSATQFNTLGSRTNNIGDGFGIGAGVASTILSVIAARKQNGPSGTVGEVPNMLAPLFDREPTLNTFYPANVLQYLNLIPPNEDPTRGTRLDQLKAQWVKSGRLSASTTSHGRDVEAITSSADPGVKVSIQDLSNRVAMLVDVSGRVSLMKRDLATLMRSMGQALPCGLIQ